MCSETVLPEVMTVWLEAQTKKGTHDACHVYTQLWLNLTPGDHLNDSGVALHHLGAGSGLKDR